LPRLYTELAGWFHLLTAPEDYAEEAGRYRRQILEAADGPVETLLELGSGGGNMASHYKRHFASTLTDLSEEMLALSRPLNPECEHVQGDMRTLRLGRTFDVVFVHDAVTYLTSEDDLKQAMVTAFVHLRPGGVALFAPDFVRETFVPGTEHGGHDGDGRALRYLMWTTDADPADSTYEVDFVYLLREGSGPPRCVQERHLEGLFGRDDWLRLLAAVGFRATSSTIPYDDIAHPWLETFVAIRPTVG
jgi:SAM-dependent methyltransferase